MERTVYGWQIELTKCMQSIENISKAALKSIKQGRIQNHFPFDDSFKNSVLGLINARVGSVYTNLMYEDILVDGQNLLNHDVNHQNTENDQAIIGQQLTSETIGPESIEQMPIILVSSNDQNLASNGTASTTTFVPIISMPSNQVPISSEVVINANQVQPAQSIQIEDISEERSEVKEEPRTAIKCEAVVDEPSNESNRNKGTENLKVNTKRLGIASTSTGVNLTKYEEPFEQAVNANKQHTETIDLTSDQEDVADTMDCEQNDDKQMQPIIQRQKIDEAKVAESSNKEGSFNLLSDHQESGAKSADNDATKRIEDVDGQLQPAAKQRQKKNANAMASGNSNEKPKLTDALDTMKRRHKCEYCNYSTEWQSHLIIHIRTHTNERPYECKVCEKRFVQKQNFNRHMKTHRNTFAFQCSNCRQGFTDEKRWKLHESYCNAKGYECHLCKTVFIEKQQLVDHMRKHTGDKLRCSKCRKQVSSKASLTRHMKAHGKLFRFQCSNCRQGFSQNTPFKLHESRCKAKQFECYLCGKTKFQYKNHLLQHMRYTHTGEKPFDCSDCPMQFCSKSQLTQHTKCWH